jgi:hypothetical protein
MDNVSLLTQVITIGGPVALIAVLAIIINWKIVMRWSEEREKTAAAMATERQATYEIWSKERVEVFNHLIAVISDLKSALARLEAKL